MKSVFVWTVNDVAGLIALGLLLVFFAVSGLVYGYHLAKAKFKAWRRK